MTTIKTAFGNKSVSKRAGVCALVPSCEGVAWAVGDRVHIAHDLSDAVVARVPYVNDDGETVMTLRWLDNGRAFSWFMGDGWRDLTRLPADDHNEEKR